MVSPLSGFAEGFRDIAKEKRERGSRVIDELIKQAQLKELGYEITPQGKRGLFGQQSFGIQQRPDYVSMKDLERQKLEGELQDLQVKRNLRTQAMSGGSFGGSSNTGTRFNPYTDKFEKDPNFLNPLQQAQLEEVQRKQEAEKQKVSESEKMLRGQAEGMLGTISEVRKGKKYFGPMGNLPTAISPSTYFGVVGNPLNPMGKYGERRNWEANVNQLLSRRVIDLMTEMKQASKTGATGMGALSEKELAVLQGAATALKRDLNPDDAMKYLDQIENMYKKVLVGKQAGSTQRFGQAEQSPQVPEIVSEYLKEHPEDAEQVEAITEAFRKRGLVS